MPTNKWRNRVKLLCVLFFASWFLSGCWDRLEIEERATVLGLSIDVAGPKAEEQEPHVTHLGEFPIPAKKMIRITAQIAVPGGITLGAELQGSGDKQSSVWVVSAEGHTIEDTLLNLQQKVAYRLFLGHLRVIVVSEEMARLGIGQFSDYLRRNPEVRRTVWMLVSKGKAAELMKITPPLQRIPALYLTDLVEQSVKVGKFPEDFLGIFWSASSSKGKEAYLPFVKLSNQKTIEFYGLAFFKGDKMVGVTKPLEIGVYMAIMGVRQAGFGSFIRIPGTEAVVLVHAINRRSKIHVDIVNGQPRVTVKIRIEAEVNEKIGKQIALADPDLLETLAKAQEAKANKATMELIKKTQKQGSDIFGFGEYVRAKHAAYWNRHVKTKAKWQEIYKDVPVHVQVNWYFRRVGMKAR